MVAKSDSTPPPNILFRGTEALLPWIEHRHTQTTRYSPILLEGYHRISQVGSEPLRPSSPTAGPTISLSNSSTLVQGEGMSSGCHCLLLQHLHSRWSPAMQTQRGGLSPLIPPVLGRPVNRENTHLFLLSGLWSCWI